MSSRITRRLAGGLCAASIAAGGLLLAVGTNVDGAGAATTVTSTAAPTAATAAATSHVGGKITKKEINERMRNWYDRKPAYSQSTYIWDVGQTRKYRTDCSGFADMALHLSADDNTSAIASDSARFTRRFAVRGNHAKLTPANIQTGDVFDIAGSHDFVFAWWNPDGKHFAYYNFGGGSSGHAPPELHMGALFSASELGYEPKDDYVIYRYKNVV